MARSRRTPSEIDAIASQLIEAGNSLAAIAASLSEANMPDVLIHATLPENTHIPAIIDWVDKLKIDVRSQLRSYLNGVTSAAERRKLQNDNEKRAAAKKPVPTKKAGSKKDHT